MNSQAMTPYHDFLRKVWRMRRAQKDYFKYKSKAMLTSAQALERDVDQWLEKVGLDAARIRQLSIIPDDGKKGE